MAIKFDDFASTIPPNFKSRVLARLMPSRETIAALTLDQRRELLVRKQTLERAIDAEPVKYFRPNPGSQADFMTEWSPRLRGKFFFAGNKAGKSTGAAVLAAELATGSALWGDGNRQFTFRTPNKGVYYADDFDSHRATTLPAFLSWCPRRFIRDASKNGQGYITHLYLTNGTIIAFRTYDQGYDKAEGKDYDWGVCDEPPPREIYTGLWRGLTVTGGILIIAATLLKEPWLFDEIQQEFVRVYQASIYDNAWINDQARADFVSLLTPEEREIRVHGRPVTISGVVYQDFRDDAPWVIADRARLHNPVREAAWPIIMGVDPHERKPLHVMWGWLTPANAVIWFDWALVAARSVTDIFADIKAREEAHGQPTTVCVMDPNRGMATQLGGRTWENEFSEHGYDVLLGDDNMQMGHADVKDMLRHTDLIAPKMQFMEACRGKGGPIWQLLRYAWDDFSRANRMMRDPKERVREQHKDFPDIVRYTARAVMSGQLEFDTLVDRGEHATISIMRRPTEYGRQVY